MSPAPVIHLFRADLRLHDHPALLASLADARRRDAPWLPIVLVPRAEATPWGFERASPRRLAWWRSAAVGLARALARHGHALWQLPDDRPTTLAALVAALQPAALHAEDIPAPEEEAVLDALEAAGAPVHRHWQATLHAPEDLPFAPDRVPDVFTAFRQAIERTGQRARPPAPVPGTWPAPWTPGPVARAAAGMQPVPLQPARGDDVLLEADPRHALPFAPPRTVPSPWGSETAALHHLRRYVAQGHPSRYKATRNRLSGVDDSSKWSLWLATGALSARQAWAAIADYEAVHGANDGTYWLWFELLWRDHFRWLHRKHGRALYRARGLAAHAPARPLDAQRLARWTQGRTGCDLVDAAMRELAATGYLSNRLRQIVASHWLHELHGDWRIGAAWFEHHLLDHDPCSNTGNWLYLAGLGTDPRGGRRFNLDKQAAEHDADGAYRRRWLTEPALA